MMDNVVRVYARTDPKNRIIEIDSSIFLENLESWVQIDQNDSGSRDTSDAYALAKSNYFAAGLIYPDGTHRYIYEPEYLPSYREATYDEIETEREEMEASLPVAAPSSTDILGQQVAALALSNMQKDQMMDAMGAQLAQMSLDMIALKASSSL